MTAKHSPSTLRHIWLDETLTALRPYFSDAGFEVPAQVRLSVGWPKRARGKGAAVIGQCWDAIASSDKHFEIFISPALKDGARIADVIVHELCHTIAGHKAGHKGPFKQVATAVGLEGKMTATTAGPELQAWIGKHLKKVGAYPAGSLSDAKGPAKQSTRLMKCECSECGYVARVTRKWIEEAGAPYCGIKSHGRMSSDHDEGEE
jgi:hypothetical protein